MNRQNLLEIVIKAFGLYCLIQFIRSAPAVAGAVVLDQSEIIRAKVDFDVMGHCARPDIFQLIINDKPLRSVSYPSGDDA